MRGAAPNVIKLQESQTWLCFGSSRNPGTLSLNWSKILRLFLTFGTRPKIRYQQDNSNIWTCGLQMSHVELQRNAQVSSVHEDSVDIWTSVTDDADATWQSLIRWGMRASLICKMETPGALQTPTRGGGKSHQRRYVTRWTENTVYCGSDAHSKLGQQFRRDASHSLPQASIEQKQYTNIIQAAFTIVRTLYSTIVWQSKPTWNKSQHNSNFKEKGDPLAKQGILSIFSLHPWVRGTCEIKKQMKWNSFLSCSTKYFCLL